MWRLLALLLLTGCATAPGGKWARIDGQPIRDDPSRLQQARLAVTACQGEMAKAQASAGGQVDISVKEAVIKGCMADRGYTWQEAQ